MTLSPQTSDHRADPAGGQRRLLYRAPPDSPRGAAARPP